MWNNIKYIYCGIKGIIWKKKIRKSTMLYLLVIILEYLTIQMEFIIFKWCSQKETWSNYVFDCKWSLNLSSFHDIMRVVLLVQLDLPFRVNHHFRATTISYETERAQLNIPFFLFSFYIYIYIYNQKQHRN